jgi:hypothetical protein
MVGEWEAEYAFSDHNDEELSDADDGEKEVV